MKLEKVKIEINDFLNGIENQQLTNHIVIQVVLPLFLKIIFMNFDGIMTELFSVIISNKKASLGNSLV